ncbi:properdin [Elgaria multicarinata webbii]|uniref:properdin n=1 Tax=Elgaria multicarinata webbii TaxID=159646 RepID=UPI002FCD1C36
MGIFWANRFPLVLVVSWWFGGLEAPAEAQNVICYAAFNVRAGTCSDLLGEGVTADECCLNHQYGFRENENGPCRSCRAAAWSEWSSWTACSVSCTEGVQRSSRTCHGRGVGTCQEASREWQMQSCTVKDCCPVMGGWSGWGAWSACSVTCLKGVQTRKRSCSNPAPVCGGTCPGDGTETQPCDTRRVCPTHGNWGSWGNWGACSGTCTPEGAGPKPTQQRQRQCNNPQPSVSPRGNPCPGGERDHRDCAGLPFCPRDGNWGSWKPAGPCAVTCGVGRVQEKRLCNNPEPRYGGKNCLGPDTRSHTCSTRVPCPVDGQWSEWGLWTPCTRLASTLKVSCEEITALQWRNRKCVGQAHGGNFCPGSRQEGRSCYNIHHCSLPGSWTDWSPWGLCEPPCGQNPVKSRERVCKPKYPDFPLVVEGENRKLQNVSFWGTPVPICERLNNQPLKVVESTPCQNVVPCED